MTQNNSFGPFLPQAEFFKSFEKFQKSPFDINTLVETQRKNFKTFSEAQQIALESMQAIAYKQAELFSQIMKEQSSITKELLKEGNPEDKIAKNAELFKKSYEQTLSSLNEISELVRKSNTQTTTVLNKRLSASLKEIKSAIDIAQDNTKKAA